VSLFVAYNMAQRVRLLTLVRMMASVFETALTILPQHFPKFRCQSQFLYPAAPDVGIYTRYCVNILSLRIFVFK
jgi:hypothetical protein